MARWTALWPDGNKARSALTQARNRSLGLLTFISSYQLVGHALGPVHPGREGLAFLHAVWRFPHRVEVVLATLEGGRA